MNKTELVESIYNDMHDDFRLTRKEVQAVVDQVFSRITDKVLSDESVSISKFGQFSLHQRNERKGRNLRTGETVMVPASKFVHFKAAKALKNLD